MGRFFSNEVEKALRYLYYDKTAEHGWEAVELLKKAEHGEPYCQYMIGNVYYWGDFLDIEEKDKTSFPSDGAFLAYLAHEISHCEEWYQKAFAGGVQLAGYNLENYYREGFEDLIDPQPKKISEVIRQGAEIGYPYYQFFWGGEIECDNPEQALALYQRALSGGEWRAYGDIGRIYAEGKIVPKDERYAVSCWEKGVKRGSNSCRDQLGRAYMYGMPGAGIEKNPAKGYGLLKAAYDDGDDDGAFELGKCCFKGIGTNQDYEKAREYLENADWDNKEVLYMLGYLYARGQGGPEDIAKGVEYLKKAGDWQPAMEELEHYKKKLFGKWVRR